MRAHYLSPLISGLLILGITACGDDSSDDDGTTDDVVDSGGGNTDDDATEDDTDDTSDDTDDTSDDTDDTSDDTDDTSDDTDDDVVSDDAGVDAGPGDAGPDDEGDAGDGGDVDADGGMADGGDIDADGGMADGGVEADADVDAGPVLPEGACAESPANPDNGTYADCSPTLEGGTCELTCTDPTFIGGISTCVAGEWTPAQCVELGSLTARIGDASNGSLLNGATVYIEGFYDPASPCEDSLYCQVTAANGLVEFVGFPAGDQNVVIVADGYEQIALPVNIAPESDQTIRLDALPVGFLDGNIVIVLGWEANGDLDLVLDVPGDEGQCVHAEDRGALDEAPMAQLGWDADGGISSRRGPETIRIALNEDGTGPAYDGTYSLSVATPAVEDISLQGTLPSVRLIRAGEGGAAEVELFQLPETAVENAHTWHVFDLHGDGTLTAGGDTESLTDPVDSELACVADAYAIPD